ncbi:MAG: putative transposase [Syntrophaceae bacterium]|nr:MAG: putative transposase [Syntrophaceae bacterium]
MKNTSFVIATRDLEILELSRSGIYYTPVPLSAIDMELMRQIDEIHLFIPVLRQPEYPQ